MDQSTVRADMQAIVSLLNSGRVRTDFNDKDIVLVLGSNDSAKKAFFQFFSRHDAEHIGPDRIVPRRVVDEKTQTVYYDIPMFDGNRSHPENIAAAFFTKRITDRASTARILYVFDSDGFARNGVEKVIDIMQFTTRLVQEIDKFDGSIAFVVVNNERSRSTQGIVLNKVVSTLRETLTVLLSSRSSQNQITIINNVLITDGDNYPRIGIVENVSANETSSFAAQKKIISEIVEESIEPTGTSENDFLYAMPDDSLKQISHLTEGVKSNVISEVALLGDELKRQYRYKEKTFTNLRSIKQDFESAWNTLVSLLATSSLQDFVEETVSRYRSLHIALPRRHLNNIAEDAGYFQILETFGTIPSSRGAFWSAALNDTMRYFTDTMVWYEFLEATYNRLIEYEVQDRKKEHYKRCSVKLEELARKSGEKTGKDLEECLQQLEIQNRGILDLSLDNQKLRELRTVVDVTLNHEEKITCVSPNKLEVEGRFVRLSEAHSVNCNYTVTFMEILAWDKLFIDTNVNATNLGRSMVMIAPVWEIVGSKEILLGGTNNTGSLLGVGHSFINGTNLFLSAQNETSQVVNFNCHDNTCGPRQAPLCSQPWASQTTLEETLDIMDDVCHDNVKAMYNSNAMEVWNEICEEYVGHTETVSIIDVNKTQKKLEKRKEYTQVAYKAGNQTNYLFSCVPDCATVKGVGGIRYCSNNGRNLTLYSTAHESLLKYRARVRQYLVENSLARDSTLQFLQVFDRQKDLKKMQTTSGLIQEFLELEGEFQNLRRNVDVLPLYQSLLSRILFYAEYPKPGEDSLEHKKVLSYLYTSCLGKIYSIQVDKNLIIDVKGFVKLALNRVTQLASVINDEQYQETIRRENDAFQASIAAIVEEAFALVEERILPSLDASADRLMESIESLIEETIQLQEDALAEREQLEETYRKLQRELTARKVTRVFRWIGRFLSVFSKVIGPVGAIITLAADVADALIPQTDVNLDDLLELPEGIANSVAEMSGEIREDRRSMVRQLTDASQELSTVVQSDSSARLSEALKKINVFREEIESDTDLFDPEATERFENRRSQILDLLKNSNRVDRVRNIVSFIGRGAEDLYAKYSSNNARLQEVAEAIFRAEEKYQSLIRYEALIYRVIMPLCSEIIEYARQISQGLENQSSISLSITQWDMQRRMNDARRQLQQMTEGFDAQDDILYAVDEIDAAMSVMINVYDRVQGYHDQGQLAAFIAAIHTREVREVVVQDPELNEALTTLIERLRLNIVSGQYERALTAYKQYAFPFAQHYLSEFNLVQLKENDTAVFVTNIQNKMRLMSLRLAESDVSITGYDRFKHANVNFDGNSKLPPFAIWRNDTHTHTISRLLSGEEVVLRADITQAKHSAVKFRTVSLNFKSLDEQINLQNFTVVMKHLGNSIYRCRDSFYTIPSEVQTISYTFNQPTQTNVVFDKLSTGNFVLSPYASWSIKLESPTGSYDALDSYKGKLDLELQGLGQYVAQDGVDLDVCYSLENYYETEDVVTQMFNMDLFDDEALEAASKLNRFNQEPDPPELSAHNSAASFHSDSLIMKALRWIGFIGFSQSRQITSTDIFPVSSSFDDANLRFIGDGLERRYEVDFSDMNCHGNLLLYDTLIRKYTGVNTGRNSHYENRRGADFQAQETLEGGSLAYRYYATRSKN